MRLEPNKYFWVLGRRGNIAVRALPGLAKGIPSTRYESAESLCDSDRGRFERLLAFKDSYFLFRELLKRTTHHCGQPVIALPRRKSRIATQPAIRVKLDNVITRIALRFE